MLLLVTRSFIRRLKSSYASRNMLINITKASGTNDEAGEIGEKFGMQVSTEVARKKQLLMRLNYTMKDFGRNDHL